MLVKSLVHASVIFMICDKLLISLLLWSVHTNNIKMLYFDIIDISKGTDVNKTNASKECIICDN